MSCQKNNKPKRGLRKLLYIGLGLFALLNAFTAIQSYSMTHFVDHDTNNPTTPQTALSAIVVGVDLPRPVVLTHPNRPYEAVTIPADGDNTLDAWVMHSDSVSRGMAILFHGYAVEKSSMLQQAYLLMDMGYDVLLPNFRGSDNSYGNQTTLGHFEADNVQQSYRYAVDTLGEKRIVLVGFSMGAAAITKALHDYRLPVEAVILEAPYGRMFDAVSIRMGSVPIVNQSLGVLMTFWGSILNGFNAFEMNPQDYVTATNVPTLMLYGGQDKRIPIDESERVFAHIGSSRKVLHEFTDAGHEDYTIKFADEWKATVSQFLNDTAQ